MSTALQDRVERLLEQNETCPGYGCGNQWAAFRRRPTANYWTLHLQCTQCGRSVSGPLPRKECVGFDELDQWDTALGESWEANRAARVDDWLNQRACEQEERRQRYHQWLLTSPEWRAIRHRVLQRANHVCECCLEAEARDVHHETYDLGVLPPAWLLRAVCRTCHNSLHNYKITVV